MSVASVDAAAQLFPARKPKPAGESAAPVRARVVQAVHAAPDGCAARKQALPLSGVLRADWLTKHRQHRPALAVVFFQREAVMSDATHGAVCAQLEAVRAAVRRRGASLRVVLVSNAPTAPLPEDRLAGLLRRAALDARFVVPLVVVDEVVHPTGLRRLALMLQETAAGFYRVEGARAAAKLGPRLVHSEASARAAFKVRSAASLERTRRWLPHGTCAGCGVRGVSSGLVVGTAVLPGGVHGCDRGAGADGACSCVRRLSAALLG